MLLGALNTSFLATDLVSLYVSLEVVAISAFLLILWGATTNAGWIALRYLLVSNTGLVVLTSAAGGVMALSHGLAKAGLFLTARQWAGRSLRDWRKRPLAWSLLPPLLGFTARKRLRAALTPELRMVALLSIGSVAVYARLFQAPATRSPERPTCWGALLLTLPLLLAGLAVNASGVSAADALLGLAVLALGLLLHLGLETLRNDGTPSLPQLDRLPDLLGGLGVVGAFLLVAMTKNVQPLLESGGG